MLTENRECGRPYASFESSTSLAPPMTNSRKPCEVAFIEEHGRLYRDVSHHAFDPFRRKVLSIPLHVHILHRLVFVFLVPLRILLAIVATFISYVIVKIFGPPVTKADIHNYVAYPIPKWRRDVCIFATRFLARMLLISLGFWKLEGCDHPDYKHEDACRATIISNHSSIADPCLLAYLFAPAFVAKYDVWRIPGVGRVGAAQHAFYINRLHGTTVSLAEKIAERQRLVIESEKPIPPVAIYPEGTTTNGHHLLKFRTGAFVAGLPVAPVLIKFDYNYFSPSYETIKTGKYIMGMLEQPSNKLRYYRLPVYRPSDAEKKDPSLYADNVHRYMLEESARVFGKPLISSNSNFVDKLEYHSIVRGTRLKPDLKLRTDT